MSLFDRLHGGLIHGHRVHALRDALAPLLPEGGARVLDVGCGDGWLSRLIAEARPDIEMRGIDVLVRSRTHIPVREFDGRSLPFPDKSFDAVLFIDVLHHAGDPVALLREAGRVARTCVILKDHTCDGFFAGATLRFMDRIGNARHGVALPFEFWPERRWHAEFAALGWRVAAWQVRLGLYPWPLRLFFERRLQFVARLDVPGAAAGL